MPVLQGTVGIVFTRAQTSKIKMI